MDAKKQRKKSDLAVLIIMAVLAVLLLPVLAVNLTLIIKGSLDPEVPPSVFGVAPLAVASGSMSGTREDSFDQGALIFVRLLDEEEKADLQEGDVVTFRTTDALVTHRVIGLNRDESGALVSVITKGDANPSTDGAIPLANVIGVCVGHVSGLGDFALFLQTPAGILVFVGIPVLLFIAYDIVRITLANRRQSEREGEQLKDKDEEIARLRALLEQSGSPAEPSEKQPVQIENAPEADGAEREQDE